MKTPYPLYLDLLSFAGDPERGPQLYFHFPLFRHAGSRPARPRFKPRIFMPPPPAPGVRFDLYLREVPGMLLNAPLVDAAKAIALKTLRCELALLRGEKSLTVFRRRRWLENRIARLEFDTRQYELTPKVRARS